MDAATTVSETSLTDADLVGRRVSHYAIVGLIGSGGMGRVYRARDERLCRDVAVKVLDAGGGSHDRRRSLIAEARALSRLSHPHVAGVHDFLVESGRDFLIMEFVAGATVKEIVAGGPLPTEEVLRLGRQMADGLGAAHRARIVHRDIKPANLKVTTAGQLKILDFGLAKMMPNAPPVDVATAESSPNLAGTVPYMSPEQLRGDEVDERSDIFSVGAVLYEMATARPAFPQRQVAQLFDAILHEDPPPAWRVNPLVPPGLARVIARALEKLPSRRYQSAAELGDALTRLVERPVAASFSAAWLAALWS
jgi:serine/threonine-protein kinase